VNDTLVFLAISYRMVSIAMVKSTWRAWIKSFFTGDGLLYLSKVLLQSGQVYYLSVFWSLLYQHVCWSNLYDSITIGVAIIASVFILYGTIPVELRAILVRPYFSLESAMACRVFRVVFLGVTQEDTLRSIPSNPHHRDDADDHRFHLPKFETFVAMGSTATKSNDEYPIGEGKLTGDELQRGLSRRV
jgi:hypothetical protein